MAEELEQTEETKYYEQTIGDKKYKVPEGKQIKVHPRLGIYRRVVVTPTQYAQKNTSIHASLNADSFDFQPEIEVQIPEKIIGMLKEATAPVHVYDPNAESGMGNKGAHITVQKKKYSIETIAEVVYVEKKSPSK